MNDWRYPGEREELVERIVYLERSNRAKDRALRDMADARFDDGSLGALIAGYVARNIELEDIVETLNQRLARRSA